MRVCLRWTVPATTDIADDPRQCVTDEADAIRRMPDLTKSDQRQVTRARVVDSLVHVASSRSRGGPAISYGNAPAPRSAGTRLIRSRHLGRRRLDIDNPESRQRLINGLRCSVTFIRHAEHAGPSPGAALSGWRGESSGAD